MQSRLLEWLDLVIFNLSGILVFLPQLFDSDYFVYSIGITGLLFSFMDTFNRRLAQWFERRVDLVCKKVLVGASSFLLIFLLIVSVTTTYGYYFNPDVTLVLWSSIGSNHQQWVAFLLVCCGLIIILGLFVKIVDRKSNNTLATLGLTLTSTSFYFEMRDPIPSSNQTLFFCGFAFLVLGIIFTGDTKGNRIDVLLTRNEEARNKLKRYKQSNKR